MHSVISVCLSVCNALHYERLDLEIRLYVHLQNLQVKFVHQGHWVKVKFTGTKSIR